MAKVKHSDLGFNIEEIYWEDIRKDIQEINPEIFQVIEQISPSKKYRLIKARYPYGVKIVDSGVLQIPNKYGAVLPIDHETIPQFLKDQLTYSFIPLTMVLQKGNEVFIEDNHQIVPLNVFKEGSLFGLFEVMDPITKLLSSSPVWSVTAGVRSTFLLPRVSDTTGHNRIRREYGLNVEVPKNLFDQWQVFRGIATHSSHREGWYNEVIFFTKDWFNTESNNKLWLGFENFLFKECWKQLQLFRDAIELNLLWQLFSSAISNRNLRPRPYLIDTVKTLISIANGGSVAFQPAVDETFLPLELIQKVYVEIYQLKEYIPTIIQPCKMVSNGKPVYYSLALPTVMESTTSIKYNPSIMEDERDIKKLIETLKNAIRAYDRPISNPIKRINFDFFHCENDQYNEITPAKEIINFDKRFNPLTKIYEGREFCQSAPFFRGCIKISLPSS